MIKKNILFAGLALIMAYSCAQNGRNNILLIDENGRNDNEIRQILRHHSVENGPVFDRMAPDEDHGTERYGRYDIIWIHGSDTAASPPQYDAAALLEYARGGGSILLTQHALTFLNLSGIEEVPVQRRNKASEDNGYGRMLGFHAFLHHPLFDSLHGGAYILKPPRDTVLTQYGFFDDAIPLNGKVVAVDWDYIFLRENTKLIVEYAYGKGKILAVGAYFNPGGPNLNHAHYRLFYDNIFSYLKGEEKLSPVHHWLYDDPSITPIAHVMMRQLLPPPAVKWNSHPSPLDLSREKATNNYCEAAGRRLLVAAYEPEGFFELWAHPFMAFRDYRLTLYFGDEKFRAGADVMPSVMISPAAVTRSYRFPNGALLKEVMTVHPAKPVGVIHYEYEGPEANMLVTCQSNMRLMWPYSGNVLKNLQHAWQPSLNAMEVAAPEAGLHCFIGSGKLPAGRYSGHPDEAAIIHGGGDALPLSIELTADTNRGVMMAMLFRLDSTDCLDIVFAAGSEGRDSLAASYLEALQDPFNIYRKAAGHYQDLDQRMLQIVTPDENFNRGYAWALAATDRFFVRTPGLGTSLVAGYNGTDRGWDGGHAVNGRPGYAWYFGRDAVWSAFAVLDYGDFEGVRNILDMLMKFQDLNGKIFHELSTSGFVHYDAADATPLFIILASRYLARSGDLDYIRDAWPAIEKAIGYCWSTDTDGDMLIENTNAGHGWVEGGHLFGSHSSLYLVSCWAEALRGAAYMSNALGLPDVASAYERDSRKVTGIINREFYNAETGFLYQGVFSDGTYHSGESILPSIPMYFGLIDDDKTRRMLEAWSTNDFSSDWGLRMLRQSSPLFHPRGYHSGSVWPLYTGWVALAEYRHGRHLQGFGHIMQNLDIYRDFALGYLEEVLNGESYQPSGVCPHQCWSQTMVLQPLIEGMLGLEADAMEKKLLFAPSIPFGWDKTEIQNIRMGNNLLACSMERGTETTVYSFENRGDAVTIDFRPLFMPGTEILSLEADGMLIPFTVSTEEQGVRVNSLIDLSDHKEMRYTHRGGIGLLPHHMKAGAGETSSGLRIISAGMDGNSYIIETEGAAAMRYQLEMTCNMDAEVTADGAALQRNGNRLLLTIDFPAMNRGYMRKTVTLTFQPHKN
jgi:glycogen debranching enzyme